MLGVLCLSRWVGRGAGKQLEEFRAFWVACTVVVLVAVGAAFVIAGGVRVIGPLAFVTM